MSNPLKQKIGNVNASFEDLETYQFYLFVRKNWERYQKEHEETTFYNFTYEFLDKLEEFIQKVFADFFIPVLQDKEII